MQSLICKIELMYIKPQTKVYTGMVVGEHNKENDLEINVLKGKQLTNVRASGSDKAVTLVPPANHDIRANDFFYKR